MICESGSPRIILHLDMDAFFAAVEVREHPELGGKPVVVGADPKGGKGRGVVSTASYEARVFGIHSAMPISRAFRLAPHAIFLPVNFPAYLRASAEVMGIVRKYSHKVQQVSVDEAYLDLSEACSYEKAREVALEIKGELLEKTGLHCSIGIGPGKVVAKIASDYQKPDGLTVIDPSRLREFLSPMPVRKIPGIGKKTEAILFRLGIITIGQLASHDVQDLISLFGKSGIYLHQLALGQDDSMVETGEGFKSISREITFEEDTGDPRIIRKTLNEISEDLGNTLREERLLFRTITVKVRIEGFVTHTRAKTLGQFTREIPVIEKEAWALAREFLDGEKIRLIGIRLSRFLETGKTQLSIDEFIQG